MLSNTTFRQTDPYHIYYDMDIYNQNQLSEPPVQLTFQDIRSSNIVDSAGDWFLSIIRMNLTTSNSLPLMIPTVMTGQPDPNKLIYSITLTYKTFEYQQYLYYTPVDLSLAAPPAPTTTQDLSTEYYFIKTYQHFADIVNTAFTNAYNGLKALVIAGGQTLPTQNAPFMEWSASESLAIVDADMAGYDLALANPIKIYFNIPMFNLFNSFDAKFYGYTGVTNGKNYLLQAVSIGGTNILNLATYSALQIYQQTPTASLWNPVKSIVFTSTLPMNPSMTSKPTVVSGSNLQASGQNNNIAPIITDIAFDDLQLGTEYSQKINYVASGKYRLIDLFGNNAVNNVQISVFWKNQRSEYIPFKLVSQGWASLKLLFRRKDYNV